MFTPKTEQLPWSRLLALDADALSKSPGDAEDVLESVYEALVSAQVSTDDTQASPKNLVQLLKLAQLAMELKNAYLVEAENQIGILETTISSQDQEITRLQRASNGDYMSEFRRMQEEIQSLNARNASTIKQMQALEEQMEAEKRTSLDLAEQLKNEKSKSNALNNTVDRLHVEVEQYKNQMEAQKAKAVQNSENEEEKAKLVRDKNAEIDKYLNEIQMLSNEYAQLQSECDNLNVELEVTVTELESVNREKQELEQLLVKSDALAESLKKERDLFRSRAGADIPENSNVAFSSTLLVREADHLRNQLAQHTAHAERYRTQLAEKEAEVERLRKDVETYKAECEANRVDKLKREIRERDAVIQGLREKLDESYRDFELLSMDWDKIQGVLSSQSTVDIDSLQTQLRKIDKLKSKAITYRDHYRSSQSQLKELQTALDAKESELASTKEKLTALENGSYGLSQALREIKDLKAQRSLRDKNIEELTKNVNDLQSQIDQLLEENEGLREMLGITESTKIETKSGITKRNIELQQTKSVNLALTKEIERLEEERLELKSQLRMKALERGERAVELGLSVEELIAVEEYATRLREKDRRGQSDSKTSAALRPTVHNAELSKIMSEIERFHRELNEALTRNQVLQEEKQEAKDINLALETAIREVARSIRSGTDGVVAEALAKVIKLLEERNRHLMVAAGISNSAEQSLSDVNQVLRDENEKLRSDVSKLRKYIDKSKSSKQTIKQRLEIVRTLVSGSGGSFTGSGETNIVILDHLMEALGELRVSDNALKKTRQALEDKTTSDLEHAAKLALLAQEHATIKHELETQIKDLEKQKLSIERENDHLNAKLKDFEASFDTLCRVDEQSQKSMLVQTEQNLIQSRDKARRLERQVECLLEEISTLTQSQQRLREDKQQLDLTARETTVRLRHSWMEADEQARKFSEKLAECVPFAEHQQVLNKLDLATARVKALNEHKLVWLTQISDLERNVAELTLNKLRHDEVLVDLAEANGRIKALERQVETASKAENTRADKRHLMILEGQLSRVKKRMELLESNLTVAQNEARESKSRVKEMENMYLGAVEDRLKLEEQMATNDTDVSSNGHVSDESLKARVDELEKALHHACAEVTRFKEINEHTLRQVQDLQHHHTLGVQECSSLRAQIRDLQSQSDHNAQVSVLNERLRAAQQLSEDIRQSEDELRNKCMKLEGMLAKTEKDVSDKSSQLYTLQTSHVERLQRLYQLLSEFRTRLSHTVSTHKHEQIRLQTVRLESTLDALSKSVDALSKECREVTGKIRQTEKLVELERDTSRFLSSSPNDAAIRTKLYNELSRTRLHEISLQRQLNEANYSSQISEIKLRENQRALKDLEQQFEDVVEELERKRSEWDWISVQMELLKLGVDVKRTTDSDFGVDVQVQTKAQVQERNTEVQGETLPTSTKPASVTIISEDTPTADSSVQQSINDLQSQVDLLQQEIDNAETASSKKDELIHSLQIKIDELMSKEKQSSKDLQRLKRHIESESQALEIAQRTIRVLQSQVESKDENVLKYQQELLQVLQDATVEKKTTDDLDSALETKKTLEGLRERMQRVVNENDNR